MYGIDDFRNMVTKDVSLNGVPQWKPDWLIDGLVERNAFNVLGGVQKVGKSLFRSHLLVSAVTGIPALGHFRAKPVKRALLLAGEERREVEEARLYRAAKGLGVKADSLPINIMPQKGFFFDDEESFQKFVEFVVLEEYELVVIDPLIRWHRRNENISGELSPVLNRLRVLHHFCTLLLIHHLGKPTEADVDRPLGHLLRGTSDLAAIYDNLMILKNKKGGSKFSKKLLMDCRYEAQPDPRRIDLNIMSEEAYTWNLHVGDEEVVSNMLGSEPLSANQIVKLVKRNRTKVLTCLKSLAAQGLIEETPNGWVKNGSTKQTEI